MLFPKPPPSCAKKVRIVFAATYFYLYELKKQVSDFNNLIAAGDINVFVFRRSSFLVDMFK